MQEVGWVSGPPDVASIERSEPRGRRVSNAHRPSAQPAAVEFIRDDYAATQLGLRMGNRA